MSRGDGNHAAWSGRPARAEQGPRAVGMRPRGGMGRAPCGRRHRLRCPIPFGGPRATLRRAGPLGDATVRESLAATGERFVRGGCVSMVWHEHAQRHAGDDRRIDADRRHSGAVVLQGLAVAER